LGEREVPGLEPTIRRYRAFVMPQDEAEPQRRAKAGDAATCRYRGVAAWKWSFGVPIPANLQFDGSSASLRWPFGTHIYQRDQVTRVRHYRLPPRIGISFEMADQRWSDYIGFKTPRGVQVMDQLAALGWPTVEEAGEALHRRPPT
jgi:hypothetical protein